MGSSYKYLRGSDGTGNAVLAHITSPRSAAATTLIVDSLSKWSPFYIVTTGTLDANGYMTPASMTEMYAHTNAGQIIIDGFVPGYTDVGNTAGQVAIVKPTNHFANSVVDQALVAHADDGSQLPTSLDAFYKPIEISPSPFISSGGVVAISSGLIATISNVVGYYNGLRFTKNSIANQTFAINKDTYVDIDNTGVITLVAVANNATAGMALTANSIRLAKVVTNGTIITSIVQYGSDPLANKIYPGTPISPPYINMNPIGGSITSGGSNNGFTSSTPVQLSAAYPTLSLYVPAGYVVMYWGGMRIGANSAGFFDAVGYVGVDGSTSLPAGSSNNTFFTTYNNQNGSTQTPAMNGYIKGLSAGLHTFALFASSTAGNSINLGNAHVMFMVVPG